MVSAGVVVSGTYVGGALLQKAKPKLKEYRDLVSKLEQKNQDT